MIRCTVGVFAYNEARNVRTALYALLAQQLRSVEIVEIIVVASGCTDETVAIAREVADAHPIVSVEVEVHRTGKASAIRRLMSIARGDVIVFVGADTLPAADAIEHLVAAFSDPHVGMTGARVVPLNSPESFLGYSVQMLWHVHHHLALRQPKLGELVAARNIVTDFPQDTATDDLALEALVSHHGYRLVYVPNAVVYNRGPQTYEDFVKQRRRIFAGELRIALRYGYVASSLSLRHILPLAIDAIRTNPTRVLWTLGVMLLELWARVRGGFDAFNGREEVVWRSVPSTKQVVEPGADVTFVSLKRTPGSLDREAILGALQDLGVDTVRWSRPQIASGASRDVIAEAPSPAVLDRPRGAEPRRQATSMPPSARLANRSTIVDV